MGPMAKCVITFCLLFCLTQPSYSCNYNPLPGSGQYFKSEQILQKAGLSNNPIIDVIQENRIIGCSNREYPTNKYAVSKFRLDNPFPGSRA
jgi:hypothetical protein